MNLFRKIFKKEKKDVGHPDIKFGRFSDSYKEDKKYDSWDKSLETFEEDKFLESFNLFLDYLSDDEMGNEGAKALSRLPQKK